MSERTRTDTDDTMWTRGFGVLPDEPITPDARAAAGLTPLQPGDKVPGPRYEYFARLRRVDGVPVVDAVVITGSEINTAVLRALSFRQDLALASQAPETAWRARPRIGKVFPKLLEAWDEPGVQPRGEHEPPRQPLSRPDGTDPEGFSRRVALAYNEAVLATSTPAKTLAAEAGVPVTTVHRWVRDARRLGLLPPARKGRAG